MTNEDRSVCGYHFGVEGKSLNASQVGNLEPAPELPTGHARLVGIHQGHHRAVSGEVVDHVVSENGFEVDIAPGKTGLRAPRGIIASR
jgi:hypothetical protein